jgi:hypothetical protein
VRWGEREDYVEGRVLGEGTMVVLGGEGDAWREVDEEYRPSRLPQQLQQKRQAAG